MGNNLEVCCLKGQSRSEICEPARKNGNNISNKNNSQGDKKITARISKKDM